MTSPAPVKRHVLPARARRALRVLAIGGALAAVVLAVGVAASIVRSPGGSPQQQGQAVAAPGGSAYEAGMAALASGDTTAAIELLGDAAAAGNPQAKAKLAELGSTAPQAPSRVASDTYGVAVADVSIFLPTQVPGYAMAEVETSAASAIVSAEPGTSGPEGVVSRIVFAVYDKRSAAGAEGWLADFPKAFGKDAAAVAVGDRTARFGTDGENLASVAFVRGRYAFEVIATTVSGDPKQLKELVRRAASSIAATHEANEES
jgi:hypothetical protein